jgi:2-oxoisovalerate dehydrogenase E1 component beta subunit
VVFFEPKRLYNGPFDGDQTKPAVPWSTHPKGQVDEGYYKVALGKAEIVRSGSQVTIITYGTMVYVAAAAAAAMNIDAEIIDLRSLVPLDVDTIATSVKKTGRCVIAHEASVYAGFGAEIVARITEQCFYHLEAPVLRVGGFATPYPPSRLEEHYLPDLDRILDAVDRTFGY